MFRVKKPWSRHDCRKMGHRPSKIKSWEQDGIHYTITRCRFCDEPWKLRTVSMTETVYSSKPTVTITTFTEKTSDAHQTHP